MINLLILVIPPSATGKSIKGFHLKLVKEGDECRLAVHVSQGALKEREPSCDRSIYRARRR